MLLNAAVSSPGRSLSNIHTTPEDVEKRTRLEDRMNEFLGWNGLGHCDGWSIGSGVMEVCCYVIDFKTAKHAIAEDLAGTEFENYTRISDENEE